VPGSYTYAWTIDDLLFYGVAYWLVLTTYKENGRPATARRIDPNRISYTLDSSGFNIIGYQLDGTELPQGALIAFYGTEEGIIARAGRTIRAAIELEKAAQRYAEEALPSVVITNNGPDMPADDVQALLDTWKTGRASRATAYLGGQLSANVLAMDPAALQLTEARAYVATELGRVMGIPSWYLNASANGMTYSNVTQERRDLIDFSLRPLLSIIEDRLSMTDITAGGTTVRHDFDDFLRGNPTDRADIAVKLAAAGIINIAEARDIADMTDKVAP
jgi:HK97 family phage portal protein